MGSGIALAAAQSGYEVTLFDTNETVIEKAGASIIKNLDFLVEKNKITAEEKAQIFKRIRFSSSIEHCRADLIIEAIVEIEAVKSSLFNQLAAINSDKTIFASNTSSLDSFSVALSR